MNIKIRVVLMVASALLTGLVDAQGARPMPSFQQPSVGPVGSADFPALQVTVEAEADFGRLVGNRIQGGTVSLIQNSNVIASGGAMALSGVRSVLRFRVKGAPNQSVIALPPNEVALSSSNSGATLRMTDISVAGGAMKQLDPSGNAEFIITSTLQLPANPRGGRYSASVPVTFSYLNGAN